MLELGASEEKGESDWTVSIYLSFLNFLLLLLVF